MKSPEKLWEEWSDNYKWPQFDPITANNVYDAFLAGLAAAEQRGIVKGLEMAAELSASFINCEMGCADVIAHAILAKAVEVKP